MFALIYFAILQSAAVLLYCASGCLAEVPALRPESSFAEAVMNSDPPPAAAVVREVPRKGQGAVQAYTVARAGAGSAEWAPIRIRAFYGDLKIPAKHCTAVGEKKPDFKGKLKDCTREHLLDTQKKNMIMKTIIPNAIKMHADRLLVQLVRGRLDLSMVRDKRSLCRHFAVPVPHLRKGAANADMVLYVAAGTDSSTWASPCDTWGDTRPTAGAMHIFLREVAWQTFNVRRAAHEIAHALGFVYGRMKRLGMLSTRQLPGTGGVTVISSSKTMETGRKHYGCDKFPGMVLEELSKGNVAAHFSFSFAKDELMGPWPSLTGGRYSALTLSVFEDMGYYRANWGKAEPMNWGNASTCAFLEQTCHSESNRSYPDMFCSTADTHIRCSSDRSSVGLCTRVPVDVAPTKSSTCSMIIPFYAYGGQQLYYSMCAIEAATFIPGSRTGPGSLCLDVETFQVPSIKYPGKMKPVSGVCAQVQCTDGKVQVRYQGNDDWHSCPEGQSIATDNASGPKYIRCPRYDEVCRTTAGKNTRGGVSN
ncbi:surface protease GP63 [Trypanosoma conorhini]|uniref:Leishmanolysin-like peptidase n=1 Tax=Trypanosoma conorhini TaxID=83891 RepID=A0A3R7L9G1_9TRYP|nr:surface protease GP63 [Trypanosoma conorhini]RNF23806.1 surface protease GP63 [Trypanosoma conorhini]